MIGQYASKKNMQCGDQHGQCSQAGGDDIKRWCAQGLTPSQAPDFCFFRGPWCSVTVCTGTIGLKAEQFRFAVGQKQDRRQK